MTIIHHGLDATGLAGLGSGSADKTQAAAGQTSGASPQAQSTSSGKSGEVQITSTAQLLSNVEQQISSTPDVNQSRVNSIRQALSSGSYQVDSGRVADGVLAANKFDAQVAAGSGPGAQAHSHSIKAFAATAKSG